MDAPLDLRQTTAYHYQAAPPSAMRTLHRIGVDTGLYLVTLLLLIDATLVLIRHHYAHMESYYFLRWNLLLAIVPYGVSLCTAVLYGAIPWRSWMRLLCALVLLPLYLLWLIFLPNAPYLLTDFIHLESRTPLQLWFDTALLSIYGVTGYTLAITSLAIMYRPVRAFLGWRIGWIFVIICCFLAGIGVHLGRIERYNSTDMFSQSRAVLTDVVDRLLHLYDHRATTFDGLSYGAVLLIGYVAFLALSRKYVRTLLLKG
jgi:uncharacterized membrane protein